VILTDLTDGVADLFSKIKSFAKNSWSSEATMVSTSRGNDFLIIGFGMMSLYSLSDFIVALFSSKMLILPSLSQPDGLRKF
jgi:hypothetical protein